MAIPTKCRMCGKSFSNYEDYFTDKNPCKNVYCGKNQNEMSRKSQRHKKRHLQTEILTKKESTQVVQNKTVGRVNNAENYDPSLPSYFENTPKVIHIKLTKE